MNFKFFELMSLEWYSGLYIGIKGAFRV